MANARPADRLFPAHHQPAACARRQRPVPALLGQRLHLQRLLHRPILHLRQPLCERGPARRPVPGLRAAHRDDHRGELFLQAVGIPGKAARSVRCAAGFHSTGDAPQRGDLIRQERPDRPFDHADQHQVGHPGGWRGAARILRVVRRADHVPERGGGQNHRWRIAVAGRPAPDRQGDRAFPRRVLAGVPDGRRAASAETHFRAWLAAVRERQNVEIARQHRALRADTAR